MEGNDGMGPEIGKLPRLDGHACFTNVANVKNHLEVKAFLNILALAAPRPLTGRTFERLGRC